MNSRSIDFLNCLLVVVAIVWVGTRLDAAAPASKPASSPATTQAVKLDPAIEKILDRLEQKKITDIETPITYIKTKPLLADKQTYEGILRFRMEEPNPRFLIRFDKFSQEGIVSRKKEWHAFDGQWYIEVREKTEAIIKRQVVRPGEKLDVFKLGQGPFPLPFGQKKKDIIDNFSVKLVPPDPKKDPPGSDHLECTPLPGTKLADQFGTVHFYIHRKLDLPVCIRTVEKKEGIRVEASFSPDKMSINKGLSASKLNHPQPRGYSISTELLNPPPKTKPENR
ncbi:MAG: hypothetical protein JSV03_16300 [Planctomycetota bacterium]|nr:MAG: hypothetical protein JSV03_16300 [Planctomycetota bacterium]